MNHLSIWNEYALRLTCPPPRDAGWSLAGDQRGLSQSTENAILLAGAVTVAGIVIAVITAYVKAHLPT